MLNLLECLVLSLSLFNTATTLWTGLHKSYESVLNSIHALGLIQREGVLELMLKFDRYDFLPHAPIEAWQNIPVCINYSATMPEASYHGVTLDAIYKWLKPGARCLDIGSGTGYIAACMAEMVGPTGRVLGVEHIPYIMEKAIDAIRINHAELLDDGILEFICRDGRAGYHEKGPFDVIHLGASMVNNPYHLMSQLKVNGCLVVPVGLNYEHQMLRRFIKYNDTTYKVDDISGTVQEPLLPRVEQEKQWREDCAEFNRSWDRLLETLKYKKFKEEKDRKKAEARLREKMHTRTILDIPLKDPDNYTHFMNNLSEMIPSNETGPQSPHYFDPRNYG